MNFFGYLIVLSAMVAAFTACDQKQKVYQTDVLVIGGTTSGVAAGIQSARLNAETIIVEETSWLGGMLTSAGVSATDGNHFLHSGIWQEFRDKLIEHYGSRDALATGWVSNTQFEPHVGDSIFKRMAADEKFLKIIYNYHLAEILKSGDKVTGALFHNDDYESIKVMANVVIDATDLGDGLACAGAEYDLGMESRFETGEECAPESANNIIQDLTWVAILKDYGKEANKEIPEPKGYDPELFKGCCSMTVDSVLIDCEKMINYARLPNQKYMINWPRHGNDKYLNVVELNYEQRRKALREAKNKTLCFIYYIQNELGFKHLGIAYDEFPTADKLPFIPYHREGRRLKGMVRLTVNNITDIYEGDPLYRTGISVGDYPIDHHHACNPDAPVIRFPPVPSFSVPLGSLIPQKIEGLIVADKAISVSNIMNGATRLQPCVLLTGQAAGTLAALASNANQNVRDVNIRAVQQALLDANAYLVPLFDVSPADSEFQAIQRTVASGLLKVRGESYRWANRTWFYPDSTLSVKEFTEGLHEYDHRIEIVDSNEKLTLKEAEDLISSCLKRDISAEFNSIWEYMKNSEIDYNIAITKRELSVLLDKLLRPFETRNIGFDGSFMPKT